MSQHGALENLVVLDLTRVLAGPFCTMMLADMGAKVIKIEMPVSGDDTRTYPPFRTNCNGERESLYFANINRNKQGITLNLKVQEGKEIFKKLVETADIVVENYRPGVMDKLGLGYDVLKEINPRLLVGDYTGAWYPTYYYVGVNWASEQFDPARYFDWATPEYRNTGYADLLDIYMTGLYYTLVTKAEVDKANGVVGQRTEAGMSDEQNYWYCIEGGAEWAKKITCGVVPVTGSIYVEQYEGDAAQFTRAVAQALRDTDGLMIFDIVHIINRGWWSELAAGIAEGSN